MEDHMLRRLLKFILVIGFPFVLVLVALLSFSSYWLYDRFNIEQPVAELEFKAFADDVYIAVLRSGDFCFPEEFPVYGDQWQLDASFLKWKGPAVTLGFESLYRLDRLSGRYTDVREQNTRRKLSHDLRPELWFDPFESALLNAGHWLVDTQYGSSVYHDIDTGKKYIIYKTEDALIVKTREQPATRDDGMLSIQISRACAQAPGWTDQLATWINSLAMQYLVFKQSR
jgi:hypothetical protein